MMQMCHCQGGCISTLEIFWLLMYMVHFGKFHFLRSLSSKFIAILGWCLARKINIFLPKRFRVDDAKKSAYILASFLLRLWHNTIMFDINMLKQKRFWKILNLTPHKEYIPIFTIWIKHYQSGLDNNFSHLKHFFFYVCTGHMWEILDKFRP